MKRSTPWLIALLLVAAGIVGGYYFRQSNLAQEQARSAPPAKPVPAPEEETPTKPLVRYPMPKPQADQSEQQAANDQKDARTAPAQQSEPLPPLSDSDPAVENALDRLLSGRPPGKLFYLDHIVRRIVVTVDNLPRAQVPPKYRLTKPVPGQFQAAGEEGDQTLSAQNYSRYTPYVDVLDSLSTDALVAAYVRFYPLFQQSYQELGYPNGYFNDRVVAAIDDMLKAPEPQGPIKLKRPSVMYKFADPDLEALSAGQKVMIRIGPDNARRVKAKLREFREALLAQIQKSKGTKD